MFSNGLPLILLPLSCSGKLFHVEIIKESIALKRVLKDKS